MPSSLATRRAFGEAKRRPSRRGAAMVEATGADVAIVVAADADDAAGVAATGALTFATGGSSPSANK